jgi:hypothetical protein
MDYGRSGSEPHEQVRKANCWRWLTRARERALQEMTLEEQARLDKLLTQAPRLPLTPEDHQPWQVLLA